MAKLRAKTPSLSEMQAQEIVTITDQYFQEAEEARRDRITKNKLNWDLFNGKVDWSYKQAGQSTEHLPKLANAAEQMTAFVKRALTSFGDWFSADVPSTYPLQAHQVRALMQRFLDRVVVSRNETAPIQTIIANAVKQGLMESMIVLKIHGGRVGERTYTVEPGDPMAGLPPRLIPTEAKMWRLRVDVVPTEDFYIDPTGRGLYLIHEVERDFLDVWEMAEEGVYDKEVLKMLDDDFTKQNTLNRRTARQRNQNETTNPRNRRRVVLRECWGTILDTDGKAMHKDVVWTVANGKYLIRKPEPYPLWHGDHPFVFATVIQSPHTVWSKAMFDDVASLNVALDELVNLMLDGAIAGVWGVRQVHQDWLEDPRQISGGIPQNATLVLNDSAPSGEKVVETVTTSNLPQEAMAMQQLLSGELNAAAWQNDIRLGNFPERAVKATEVVEASTNSSIMVDAFAVEIERKIIQPLLRKSWYTLLQFSEDLASEDVIAAVGVNAAFALSRMAPAERYATLAKASFKASGLSETLARARDFQKTMAYLQGVASNPLLLEAFVRTRSGEKILQTMERQLNLNPDNYKLTPEEQENIGNTMDNIALLNQLVPAGGGSAPSPRGNERSATNEARSETSENVESSEGFGNE